MKDFNEFRKTLTRDVLNDIHEASVKYEKEILDRNFDKDDYEARYSNMFRLQHEYFTMALLEKYHNWLNQDQES